MMNRFSNFLPESGLMKVGMAFIAVSIFIVVLTYYPAAKEEIRYRFTENDALIPVLTRAERTARAAEGNTDGDKVIVPVDEDFGIVIPKIGANASIIPDVNWQDSVVYQQALTRGVAHAEGTSRPGVPGNMFLFAHSGIDFYEVARYNAVFYLINKLEPGDLIDILSQGKKYDYTVTGRELVGPEAVEYLQGESPHETLTLMTCWPPGTTLKRLIVKAERVDNVQ